MYQIFIIYDRGDDKEVMKTNETCLECFKRVGSAKKTKNMKVAQFRDSGPNLGHPYAYIRHTCYALCYRFLYTQYFHHKCDNTSSNIFSLKKHLLHSREVDYNQENVFYQHK